MKFKTSSSSMNPMQIPISIFGLIWGPPPPEIPAKLVIPALDLGPLIGFDVIPFILIVLYLLSFNHYVYL